MRRLLALALLSGGCFTEQAILDTCRDGEPGCDCDDGTCVEGSECVVSIDKCVPEDCTPGTRTCTCAAGEACDGDLVCSEGVCGVEGTGSGTADSQASNASASASQGSVTDPQTSMPMTSTTSDDTTIGPATSDTGVEPTSAETGAPSTTTGIISTECEMCLEQGWSSGDCLAEVSDCMDEGCSGIYACYTMGMTDCCAGADAAAVDAWETFLACAAMPCSVDACDFVAIDCGT